MATTFKGLLTKANPLGTDWVAGDVLYKEQKRGGLVVQQGCAVSFQQSCMVLLMFL